MRDARQRAAPKGVLWALIIGAVGIIGGIGIAFVDPGITLQGWLAAAYASRRCAKPLAERSVSLDGAGGRSFANPFTLQHFGE